MFLAQRPSAPAIERFIHQSQELALSYSPIGLVDAAAIGFNVDETVVAIGQGKADFERAKAALGAWKQFGIGWVEVFPPAASTEPGTVVAVLVHHLGFWSLNGCRIVYSVGDLDRGAQFGFAYGTLTNHAESGEERFEVFMATGSDEVLYRIRAVSRPRAALARVGYPVTRFLQARFRRESAAAMKRATGVRALGQ
jgi:uncharacterized protein (UPF0548 family)